MSHETGPPLRRAPRVAFMGIRGVPARYGGFETLVEEVGSRLVKSGYDVTVFCRSGNSGAPVDPESHLGMKLVHLPAFRTRALETLTHTMLCSAYLLRHGMAFDAVIMCNAANSMALPLLRRTKSPVAIHVDGLEWRRKKWGRGGRLYYRLAETFSVRWADALITDAMGISRYYADEFGATTTQIAYGAPELSPSKAERLAEYGVEPKQFHLVVARLEPENHVDKMIEGYLRSNSTLPLLVVGSTPYPSAHSQRIEALAAQSDSVQLLGGIWDKELLDQLYQGALTYLHGHSVGGTNPSLLRAMGAATQVIAYDVVFNREVAGKSAHYCANPDQIAAALDLAEANRDDTINAGRGLAARARERYTWTNVAQEYADLCDRLASGETQRGRFSGRRLRDSGWDPAITPARVDVSEDR